MIRGHLIGSHLWKHDDMTLLSDAEIHAGLERLEVAVAKILGLKPLWFRMPYGAGADDPRVLAVLSARGYKYAAMWSDDTQDSLDKDLEFQKGVIREAAGMYPRPRLVLQHSIYETSKCRCVLLQSIMKRRMSSGRDGQY
jgi:peptidoglycan/xylan/chitin deacetylase (PgdA/CDA1 family)